MATAVLRNAILKQMRTIKTTLQNPNPQIPISSVIFRRHLSSTEQTRGTLLDKYEVTDRVISVVKNFSRVDPSKVTANAHFEKDLGLGSLETVEIVMALEEEFRFEIPDEEADKISSINMAVDYISSHPQAL